MLTFNETFYYDNFTNREKIYNDNNNKYTFHFTFSHICTKNFYNAKTIIDYKYIMITYINIIHNYETLYLTIMLIVGLNAYFIMHGYLDSGSIEL